MTKETKQLNIWLLITAAVSILSILFLVNLANASFEDLEVGAKATSLSGAFIAQADDATGIFYNPAGLATVKRPELFASYEKMYWGLSDDSNIGDQVLALTIPNKYANVGLAWHRLALDDLYKESEIKVSLSRAIKGSFYGGLTFSSLSLGYGETAYTAINPVFIDNGYDKTGMGIDAGILYVSEFINFGLSVMNINEPDMGLKYANKVSREINAGFSIKQRVLNLNLATTLADGNIKFKTGIETWLYKRALALRTGVGLGSMKYRNLTVGTGYKTKSYEIDYSFSFPLSGITSTYGSHQLSFILRFGEEEEEDMFTWRDLIRLAKADGATRVGSRDSDSSSRKRSKKDSKMVISPEQIALAQDYVIKAREAFDKGSFSSGLEKLTSAQNILKDDKEIEDLKTKGKLIVEIASEVKDTSKKSRLLRDSISAYMRGQGKKSLNTIRYAAQLYPKSQLIDKATKVVESEFAELAETEKLVPGIDLVNQKLQQALELIYAKKYIDAVSLCIDVLELEPRNILAMKRMGSAYWAIGMVKEAKSAWKKALRYAPADKQLKEFLQMETKSVRKKRAARKVEVQKASESILKEYENGVNYYKRVQRYGASTGTLRSILIRMVDKFKDKGIDMSYLQKELKKYNK